ncbi:complement C2-like, partial [Stegodyphus dumicola]|uniref:complement C2-like n=1 Tax=Stegodyphus dumicola TaxID=202533 RepID=UPI0015B1DFFF
MPIKAYRYIDLVLPKIFCDLPESLANGSIPEVQSTNITAFPYDFEITYVCNEGYRLIGSSWRFCSKNGWSGDTPYCEEIRCPDPGVPEYGLSSRDSLKVGSKVTFFCFNGYNLIGSSERYCMPNGQWNGEVARCDNEDNYCPDPGIPVNGMKNSSHYDMGSKIRFQCRPGYISMGSGLIECLPNRTWSAKGMKCIGPYEFDDIDRVSRILKLKLDDITRQQKERLPSQAIWLHRTKKRSERFILYFVFNPSRRLGKRNLRSTVDFAKAIIRKVGVSEYGTRIGASTFGSNAEKIAFSPTSYRRTEDVLRALDKFEDTGSGRTTLAASLENIRKNFLHLTEQAFGRRGQKFIIFILTD